ncbi:cupin domain-containing protein [Candidatus Rariloculus sp.]|uniref:cupin domain-containing protein n=1 Tax=Candidatus Rariloculus sp. TaxID=3101265 RepID=UPI003D0C2584
MMEYTRPRLLSMLVLIIAGLGVLFLGRAQSQSNFVGGDPTRSATSNVRTSELRFEAGSRSNWHSHGNFQVIMAEEGRGRTQKRGEPLQEMLPGVAHFAPRGVVHWHGAAPDSYLVQLTISSGETSWFEPVSDEDYLGQ